MLVYKGNNDKGYHSVKSEKYFFFSHFRYSVFFAFIFGANLALGLEFTCERIFSPPKVDNNACIVHALKLIDAKDELKINLDYNKPDQIYILNIFANSSDVLEIDYIPSKIFTYFTNLPSFQFSSKTKLIPEKSFEHASKLEIVYLSNNIESIRAGDFTGAKKLKSLTLSNNKITTIDDNAFSGPDELHLLNLYGNKLTVIRRNMFAGLSKLQSLILDANEIHTIEDGALSLPSLSYLSLNKNKLKTLSDMIFVGLNNLKDIDLNKNQLEHIGKSLNVLSNVEQINLKNNKIDDIDLIEIAKLPKLTKLWLTKSGFVFKNWKDEKLPTGSSLQTLDIGNNKLSDASELINLKILSNLETLILNSNPYTSFDWPTIKDILPKLKKLYLVRTQISSDLLKKLTNDLKANGILLNDDENSNYDNDDDKDDDK